ncbi:MAG TPA: c-type cytochrome [Pyrinomonadaceae bacterium]|nr:c-type cytochrome [Pyrinomonadaceae bacterium]
MMKFIVLVMAISAGFVRLSKDSSPAAFTQTAAQKYKNIQLFKELPATELDPTMAFISGSLGVRCNFCHVPTAFEKDDKPTKMAARRMIQMVFDLNKGSFNGESAVSCFTCHRGKSKPVSVPAIGQNLWAPTPPRKAESAPPSIDQILAKYVDAIGGVTAWEKVKSRITKGSRIGADEVLVPEEVYQKSPNKLVTITSYPEIVFTNGFNGTTAWGHSSRGGAQQLPPEVLNQLKNEAVFDKEINIRKSYTDLRVAGQEKIGERDAWVVIASPASGLPERLYFDAVSGQLVRRYVESKTILGRLPLQTDFEDFREVDGIKLPFLIRWSLPGRSWGRKVAEVKQNVPIEDSKFELPANRP